MDQDKGETTVNLEQLQFMFGDELNELAAVKVMGWEKSDSTLFWNERVTPHQSVFVKEINKWNPTTDMNDAIELLNKALEGSKYFDATLSIPTNMVILHRHTEELIIDTEDSLCRAITIASILSKE